MGETLEPYKALRIVEITSPAPSQVKLTWEASSQSNYRIQASSDAVSWQTVVEDIAGADGRASRLLNTGLAPSSLFLRVGSTP